MLILYDWATFKLVDFKQIDLKVINWSDDQLNIDFIIIFGDRLSSF